MHLQEHAKIGSKTTMRIGGTARYFADLQSKDEIEEVVRFAEEKRLPLIVLGSGSNTIFCDGEIAAIVVRIKQDTVAVEGTCVTVGCGKNLPVLINELAALDLDLSPLTGIPGTVGGAIVGNAGQGPTGVWIDRFIENVETYVDGEWKIFAKEECGFGYRRSRFLGQRTEGRGQRNDRLSMESKHPSPFPLSSSLCPPLLWSSTLTIPRRPRIEIEAEINRLLQRRIETQPHLRTAGSCFKAVGTTPAWQLIDAVGLRGYRVGGIEVSQKHANFLLNVGEGTYADAVHVIKDVQGKVNEQLSVEMRFYEPDGSLQF